MTEAKDALTVAARRYDGAFLTEHLANILLDIQNAQKGMRARGGLIAEHDGTVFKEPLQMHLVRASDEIQLALVRQARIECRAMYREKEAAEKALAGEGAQS